MLKELDTVLEEVVVEKKETKHSAALKDGKTGKAILDGEAYVTVRVTSEMPIRILKTSDVIDETYYLSEKNARKLLGSSIAFLKHKGK